jgi:hypothetical protein
MKIILKQFKKIPHRRFDGEAPQVFNLVCSSGDMGRFDTAQRPFLGLVDPYDSLQ